MERIFLCCEFNFEHAETPLQAEAERVCEALRGRGYDVFFTSESSPDSGVDGYLKSVSSRLDAAKVLILVSEVASDCESGWVRFEWESFYRDIQLLRRKKYFVSYTAENPSGYSRDVRVSPNFRWGELPALLAAVERFLSESSE